MFYAPHTLQKRIDIADAEDDFGRPIVSESEPEWITVCRCRCDCNMESEIQLDDGKIITPDYHVVCEGNNPEVNVGDYVRCMGIEGEVRGKGRIIKKKTLNYLPYGELYL